MRCALVLLTLLLSAAAQAQTWPARPIRLLLADAPGVQTDTLARGLVEPLGKALGQPIIVENRVGADGIIGMEACARAAPDGHTLCGTASNVIIWNTVLRSKLPYDVLRDFVPVMHAGFFDSAMVVHPSVAASTVQQLIDHSKANPAKVNWGHFGINSTGYMYMEWLNRNKGASFYPVPYKAPPQAMQAIVVGEAGAGVMALASSRQFIRTEKLRALAVTSNTRSDWLPGVPTFEELGIKLPLRTWFGYHYQAAIPRELVVRMNAELRKVFESPSFKTQILDRMYLTRNTGTPEEFDAFIREQISQVRELVANIGLKPE